MEALREDKESEMGITQSCKAECFIERWSSYGEEMEVQRGMERNFKGGRERGKTWKKRE